MDLGDSFLFSFSGRIPRSIFWSVEGLLWPVGSVIGVYLARVFEQGDSMSAPKIVLLAIGLAWCIASIWISLALWTKRWHDAGKSGWWSLLMMVPCVGPIALIALGAIPGTPGANQYGPDPRVRS